MEDPDPQICSWLPPLMSNAAHLMAAWPFETTRSFMEAAEADVTYSEDPAFGNTLKTCAPMLQLDDLKAVGVGSQKADAGLRCKGPGLRHLRRWTWPR